MSRWWAVERNGKVYKAIHVYTGGMVALKKIRMEGRTGWRE